MLGMNRWGDKPTRFQNYLWLKVSARSATGLGRRKRISLCFGIRLNWQIIWYCANRRAALPKAWSKGETIQWKMSISNNFGKCLVKLNSVDIFLFCRTSQNPRYANMHSNSEREATFSKLNLIITHSLYREILPPMWQTLGNADLAISVDSFNFS